MVQNQTVTFKDLIAITKRIEALQAEGKTPADMLDELNEMHTTASHLFHQARTGDDIFVYSGRCKGDDDDTVGVLFAQDYGEAQEMFLTNSLDLDDDAEERVENSQGDKGYFIITDDTLTSHLVPHNPPEDITHE